MPYRIKIDRSARRGSAEASALPRRSSSWATTTSPLCGIRKGRMRGDFRCGPRVPGGCDHPDRRIRRAGVASV